MVFRYPGFIALFSAGGIVNNVVSVYGPLAMGALIDAAVAAASGGPGWDVTRAALTVVLVQLIVALARTFERIFARFFVNRVENDMRYAFLGAILRQPMASLSKQKSGDMISRGVGDVNVLTRTLRMSMQHIFNTGLYILVYLVTLFTLDWKLTLICAIPIPLTLFFAEAMRGPIYELSLKARRAAARTTVQLVRMLGGVSVLRVFGKELEERARLNGMFEDQSGWTVKASALQSGLMPVYAMLAGIGAVLVLAIGGKNVVEGAWTIGGLTAYLTLFLSIADEKTRAAARIFNQLSAANAAWARIREVYDSPEGKDPEHPDIPRANARAMVEMKGLTFRFPTGEVDAVGPIDFSAKAGQIIGVTGAVGSGKSALCHALTGLYPYGGSLKVGGVELSNVAAGTRAAFISYTGHESFLFSDSLEGNISFAADQPDDVKVEAAAKAAGLWQDLDRFPEGLKTAVGEKGVRVSGGQRQRLSLARALYGENPIVLLDDPFSAVDPATEKRILESVRERLEGRTVFLFTHRLQSLSMADHVLVLDHGRVCQSGTHAALSREDGLYRDILDAQRVLGGDAL